ncbi:MAG: type II toxin-antitoxin system VapC family toxin [Dehalococcoidales bacterium]|nr:type II toxin-antitoxin system VapC family toxin [Dehalococcoidales bacterium]
MVLVDTSVWINHFREGNAELEKLLNESQVMCHRFIIGEIACGNIRNRTEILTLLQQLPQAIQAKNEEVMGFIETNKLMGRGLGYIDMHLSVSAKLTGIPMWTFDKRLGETNKELGIIFK